MINPESGEVAGVLIKGKEDENPVFKEPWLAVGVNWILSVNLAGLPACHHVQGPASVS